MYVHSWNFTVAYSHCVSKKGISRRYSPNLNANFVEIVAEKTYCIIGQQRALHKFSRAYNPPSTNDDVAQRCYFIEPIRKTLASGVCTRPFPDTKPRQESWMDFLRPNLCTKFTHCAQTLRGVDGVFAGETSLSCYLFDQVYVYFAGAVRLRIPVSVLRSVAEIYIYKYI